MQRSIRGGLLPRQVFAGRYRVVRAITAGGMGVIYEVRHQETEAVLALKVMLSEKAASAALRERFRQEWRLAANLESEHVVRVFDAGLDEETQTPFLVMERLVGEDLGARLAREGPLPPEDVAPLMEQLARALARIHAAGVVHRDIKPSNLFVTRRDDGSPLLKVLDFGVAKTIVETTSTLAPTLIVGSPPYMPPEQLDGDGDIGAAADLYAFAHVAFALLTGSAYWSDEHARSGVGGLRRAIGRGLPEPASARAAARGVSLPPAFDAWFAAATALDADERPASPIELVSGLSHALREAVPQPLRVTAVPCRTGPSPRSQARARLSIVVTCALGFVMASVVAVSLLRARGAPSAGPPDTAPRPAAMDAAASIAPPVDEPPSPSPSLKAPPPPKRARSLPPGALATAGSPSQSTSGHAPSAEQRAPAALSATNPFKAEQ
jgi:serine/threonine-protein kinase